MPFTVASASEQNSDYRNFFLANHPGKFKHVYSTIQDQLKGREGRACCLHESTNNGSGCDPWAASSCIDLMVTGSPCDPFSVQRSKRFRHDAVKTHKDFDTTMDSVVSMYRKFEPSVGILEQVKGFIMPFVAGGAETPLDRCFARVQFSLLSHLIDVVGPTGRGLGHRTEMFGM